MQVPTLILVGEFDVKLGPRSVENLSLLPNHAVLTIPGAGHTAYIDKPKLWHKILYNFMKNVPLDDLEDFV